MKHLPSVIFLAALSQIITAAADAQSATSSGKTAAPVVVQTEKPKIEVLDSVQLIPIRQDGPVLPGRLAHLNGKTSIAFTVNPYGYVIEASVLSATNPDLGELGRIAVLYWRFEQVFRNGVPVSVNAIQPMIFGHGSFSVDVADQVPSVRDAVMPKIPDELKDASGTAHAVFEIDASGRVTNVTVADCSAEAFKAAILAVAKDWTFNPALHAGIATPSRVMVPFIFGPKYASL